MLLPGAYRSLSRLSSALSAKASALCPSLLDLLSPAFPALTAEGGCVASALAYASAPLWPNMYICSRPACFLKSGRILYVTEIYLCRDIRNFIDVVILSDNGGQQHGCCDHSLYAVFKVHLMSPFPFRSLPVLPGEDLKKRPGSHLLSHAVPSIVPSAA